MGKLADSNQVLETYVDALNAGQEVETINREFEEFLKKNVTFLFDENIIFVQTNLLKLLVPPFLLEEK